MSIEDYLSIGTDLLMRNFIKLLLSRNAKQCISVAFINNRVHIFFGIIYVAIILHRNFSARVHITEIIALC